MAGLSSRFFKEGYKEPKYMLIAKNKTLFEHAVASFSRYFKTEYFLFIVRDVYQTYEFVTKQAKSMGIMNFHVVRLEQGTKGQAETVMIGISEWKKLEATVDDCSITIFNIDTFRPGFTFPDLDKLGDGYLEVFKGTGVNWSFAKPLSEDSTRISETAEKTPISDLCCTGLYHFKSLNRYISAYMSYLEIPEENWEKGELYVAPLYNNLIKNGFEIHYNLISRDEVIFCGVPSEYDDFKRS